MESEITTLRILIKISLNNDRRQFRNFEESCPLLKNLYSVGESDNEWPLTMYEKVLA